MSDADQSTSRVEQTMELAASRLQDALPHTVVEWGWEPEFYGEGERPRITVTAEIESVEDWQALKRRVRLIVRETEPEGVLIYTHVARQR